MKYYISKINVRHGDKSKGEPSFVADEKILTKSDSEKATKNSLRRMSAIGIENICMVKYERKRYNRLMREQNRRTKPVTVADVAEAMQELTEEANESCRRGEH